VTPGAVDLKVVHDRLRIARTCVAGLRSLPADTLDDFCSDLRNPAAADSLLRRAIEALFDTARHLLSKAHGLGALEYREVARHAHEKRIIADQDLARRFQEMAGYRNRLTHFYDEITSEELFDILRHRLGDLDAVREALIESATELAADE